MTERTVREFLPGEIRLVGVLQIPAVVVCVTQDPQFGDDLRVVPVSAGANASTATDRDVVIRGAEYSSFLLAGDLLAHAWLAEPISLEEIGTIAGTVTAAALQRIRDVELIALGAVESQAHAGERGRMPYARAANDEAHAVRTVHRLWRDNLELTGMVHSGLAHIGRIAVKGATMAMRRFFREFTTVEATLPDAAATTTGAAEQAMTSTKEHSVFAHAA